MTGLGAAQWPMVAAAGTPQHRIVLLPLGSCEQHGPHLPFATDTLIADAVASRAADQLKACGVDVWCAPAVGYGASGEHQHFPGTLSIGHDALRQLIIELGRSVSEWAGRLVLVNGHGGNLPTVSTAVRLLRQEGRDAAWCSCVAAGADAHAGRTETSLLLAIAPRLVHLDRAAAGATEPISTLLPQLREVGVAGVSPNGVLGDPAGASASEGEHLLDLLVGEVGACVRSGMADKHGRLRPVQRASAADAEP